MRSYISLHSDGVNYWNFNMEVIWANEIQSLRYLSCATLGCTDIRYDMTGIRKSEFVTKTQILWVVCLSVCLFVFG